MQRMNALQTGKVSPPFLGCIGGETTGFKQAAITFSVMGLPPPDRRFRLQYQSNLDVHGGKFQQLRRGIPEQIAKGLVDIQQPPLSI